jgi:fatty acid desaturase
MYGFSAKEFGEEMAKGIKRFSDPPYEYISFADLYWRPLVDKSLKTPFRRKIRCVRVIVRMSIFYAFILACLWAAVLSVSHAVPWVPRIGILLLGVGITLWGAKKATGFWRDPTIPRPLKSSQWDRSK